MFALYLCHMKSTVHEGAVAVPARMEVTGGTDGRGSGHEHVSERDTQADEHLLVLFAQAERPPARTVSWSEEVLGTWEGFVNKLTELEATIHTATVPFPQDDVRRFHHALCAFLVERPTDMALMSNAEFFTLMDKLCAARDRELPPLEDGLSGKDRERREHVLAWRDIVREVAENFYVQYRSVLLERAAESHDGLPTAVHALRALGHFSMLGYDVSCCPEVRALAVSVAPYASRARAALMARKEIDRAEAAAALGRVYIGLVAAGNTVAIHEAAADFVSTYRDQVSTCTNPGLCVYTALSGEMGGAPELAHPYDPFFDLKSAKTPWSSAGPGTHLMLQILKTMNVPQWPCVLGWREDGYWKEPVLAHVENLTAAARLERASPGSTTVLHREFGVRCFRRYPDPILLEQVANAHVDDAPYGYMLLALEDHNGAFAEPISQRVDLYESAAGCGVLTRILEFGSIKELSERLARLSHRYGLQSASFVYGEGHGSTEGIRLSRRTDELLTAETLGTGPGRSALYFAAEAPVFLDSCRTGEGTENFGKKLSEVLRTTVAVPTHSSYGVRDLRLVRGAGGNLMFEGTHIQKKAGATTRTYHKGVLVQEVPRIRHVRGEP